jgi:hypothetical protein
MYKKCFSAVFFLVWLGLFLLACNSVQPSSHEIRIKNNYRVAFTQISVGPDAFMNVRPGDVTRYQQISEGEQKVKGECPPAGHLEGTLSFSGQGHHQWTVVVGVSGYLTVIEDTQT